MMVDLPGDSVGMSIYSPPFGGLYCYSSSERDLSNCLDYDKFFEHYDFVVEQVARLTSPGRMTAVHCMDVPVRNKDEGLIDFPGDIIRQHKRFGFDYWARYAIWKEPLRTAIRTRSRGLTHRQIVKDSTFCGNAGADYLLIFKKRGENKIPIANEFGLTKYCGEREIPEELEKYVGWKDPKTNKRAHWIWQQYASSFWDDIRIGRCVKYKPARESEEEKHCHPLQLDVIERCVQLWSNPGEIVFTPFMGVGSEVCGAVVNDRIGLGIELKESYYRQSERNIEASIQSLTADKNDQSDLFSEDDEIAGDLGDAEME